jgi:hypothetical protein
MAIVINGSGTVTGLAVGGLPDGTVDAGTLATNSVDSAELVDGAVDNSHLADDAVAVAELSATGTASSSTFLRGDNAWAEAGGGKVLKAAFTNTLQKTGTWTDTSEHTILSLAYTPVSATSTLYITNNLTFQMYGAGNGTTLEIQMHTKEDGTTIVDGRDLHWNIYPSSSEIHFTPSNTQSITRPSSNTNSRTYTVTLQMSLANRRLQIGSYYPRFLQILEVEA